MLLAFCYVLLLTSKLMFGWFFFPRVVKEEICDEEAHLPCFNGRVVSWVSNLIHNDDNELTLPKYQVSCAINHGCIFLYLYILHNS